MKIMIALALVATMATIAQNDQTKEDPTTIEKQLQDKADQLDYLTRKRQLLIDGEKESLKKQVAYLNDLVEKGEISKDEATQRKRAFAEDVALNIENETAIIDNQMALVERNGRINNDAESQVLLGFGLEGDDGKRVYGVTIDDGKVGTTRVYDRRTYGELVLAFGLNNAITEQDTDFGDEFSIGRSRFFELGYAWKTRVFKNSGALQFKYGISLQTNKLFTKDNRILVNQDNEINFEEFPLDLDKSQLRFSNLVAPVHLEFGGWKKEQEDDYVRYRISGKFRMGIGGYVGLRLGTQQKLKYKEDGNGIKLKEKEDFNGDNFVYGLSSYIRVSQDLSIYGKYDLSSAFQSRELGEVNNVSLGLRWDW